MVVPVAQLSCEQCQHRKTKCSKTVPCTACVKAGITCTAVQRHRLPRGRSRVQKRDSTSMQTIADRVGRLETIIAQFHSSNSPKEIMNRTSRGAESQLVSTNHSVESFVASDFWLQLSDTVIGLRGVLEQDDAVDIGLDEQEAASTESSVTADSHRILFPSSASHTYSNNSLSPETREWLISIYKDRVDAMFKPLHWPSALSAIHSRNRELSPEARCLKCAIFFTATCSLFDFERDQRSISREELRKATEAALIQADLLTTTSMMVLQAFVVYLAGLRTVQATAQQWTLIATAIRIANAQGIPVHFHQSFVGEIQRRMWHCIGVLDLQSAFDRGSQPLLKSADLGSLPLDIDDAEMSSTIMPSSACSQKDRYTEMSLSLMTFRAGTCQRRLTEIGLSACLPNAQIDPAVAACEQVAVLSEFERHAEQLTRLCNDSPSPLKRFTVAVANGSLVAMRLQLHRPLYRRPSSLAPMDMGPLADVNVLTTATEVLERSQTKRTQLEFAPWAWFSWVKWYALAIVLVEICTTRGPQADHAWMVAQRSFDDYAKAVADERFGLLWRPIANLMRRAKEVREGRLSVTQSPFSGLALPPQRLVSTEEATSNLNVSNLALHQWGDNSANTFDYVDFNGITDDPNAFDLHWNLLIDDLNTFDTYIS